MTGDRSNTDTGKAGAGRFSFGKAEKIYLKDEIEAVFASRASFVNYPARTLYLLRDGLPGEPRVKLLISVPKKRIRHAVGRNRVKRLFREAFRLRKEEFSALVPSGSSLLVSMVFVADKVCSFSDAEASISKALAKLAAALSPEVVSSDSLDTIQDNPIDEHPKEFLS